MGDRRAAGRQPGSAAAPRGPQRLHAGRRRPPSGYLPPVLGPAAAAALDRKLDNGLLFTGNVRAFGGYVAATWALALPPAPPDCGACVTAAADGGTYATTDGGDGSRRCNLLFAVGF